MINKKSRYHRTATTEAVDVSATTQELIELRQVPPTPAVFTATVGPGVRLDHLAEKYYQDPRKFWKICDAMDELDPFDVVVPGAAVRVPPDK